MKAVSAVDPKQLYSLRDICEALDVTPAVVRAWWREGLKHRPRRGTTRPYFSWGSEIIQFIKEAYDG